MRSRSLKLVVGILGAALATTVAAAPGYQVVLTSGARVSASSRPVIAMGKVSFLDENRRPTTLPAAMVDVPATRAARPAERSTPRVWNAATVSQLKGARVQFYGEAPAASDDDASATPAERLRSRIEGIEGRIKSLPTSDRQRSMLVTQQRELQEELARVLTSPTSRG